MNNVSYSLTNRVSMLRKQRAASMPANNQARRKAKTTLLEALLELNGEEGLLLLEDGDGIELDS